MGFFRRDDSSAVCAMRGCTDGGWDGMSIALVPLPLLTMLLIVLMVSMDTSRLVSETICGRLGKTDLKQPATMGEFSTVLFHSSGCAQTCMRYKPLFITRKKC